MSGIPNCSESMVNKFKLNSDTLSPFLDSKTNLRAEGSSSSEERVIWSSFPAILRIFYKFSIESPRVRGLSHLYLSNPFSLKVKETKATWEESMAWRESPYPLASILTFLTNSLMESTIFLKMIPCSYLASNIWLNYYFVKIVSFSWTCLL